METELMIRDDKSLVHILRVLTPIFLWISVDLTLSETYVGNDILYIFFMGVPLVIIWIIAELRNMFLRYYFSVDKCYYSNFVGKKKEFFLADIHKVYPKRVSFWGSLYVVEAENGQILVMIRTQEKNSEKLLPFLQAQKKAGNWNGNLLKELDVLDYELLLKRKGFHVEKRMVQKNRVNFKQSPDPLIVKLIKENRNEKRHLILSTEMCEYKKDWKNTVRFHFDEIEDINLIVNYYREKGIYEYLHIVLKDGKTEVFPYSNKFTNISQVQPYVAYHREKKQLQRTESSCEFKIDGNI